MKVIVTGATGNVGTSVLGALAREPAVTEIVGIARRQPGVTFNKTRFFQADVAVDELESVFRGAAAVVHLAWLLQPTRNVERLHRVNVQGSRRVFQAAVAARVPAIIHASSVGVYSPGPKDRAVDESWPTDGIGSCLYSRQKAVVERQLDDLEHEHPETRVVRLRSGLIFKRAAGSEMKRLFLGKLVPSALFRTERIPFVPDVETLRFQAVHSLDIGEAYRAAIVENVRGAFNVAADPVIDPDVLSKAFHARRVKMSAAVLRRAVSYTYRLRLQPAEPGWVDLALNMPIMDIRRAHEELGWKPTQSSTDALLELLQGINDRAGMPTAPLEPAGHGAQG